MAWHCRTYRMQGFGRSVVLVLACVNWHVYSCPSQLSLCVSNGITTGYNEVAASVRGRSGSCNSPLGAAPGAGLQPGESCSCPTTYPKTQELPPAKGGYPRPISGVQQHTSRHRARPYAPLQCKEGPHKANNRWHCISTAAPASQVWPHGAASTSTTRVGGILR